MKNIYFAGSIRGGRNMADVYKKLIAGLRLIGTVFTEHVGDEQSLRMDDESLRDLEIFERDMEWIRSSDLMIAEVSQPSLGVGFEIASAIMLEKPVLCLYNENSDNRLSAMISGNSDLTISRYGSLEEAESQIAEFLSGLN